MNKILSNYYYNFINYTSIKNYYKNSEQQPYSYIIFLLWITIGIMRCEKKHTYPGFGMANPLLILTVLASFKISRIRMLSFLYNEYLTYNLYNSKFLEFVTVVIKNKQFCPNTIVNYDTEPISVICLASHRVHYSSMRPAVCQLVNTVLCQSRVRNHRKISIDLFGNVSPRAHSVTRRECSRIS